MSLDRIDFEIISALQNDARLSNKELAARIGLAPSTCLERVRQLRESDVIVGAHARINPEALGIGLQAMISVRLRQHAPEAFDNFNRYAIGLREVIAVYHVAGGNDFLLHVAVRNAEHLRHVAFDHLTTRPEVEHMETALIFSYMRDPVLPNLVEMEPE